MAEGLHASAEVRWSGFGGEVEGGSGKLLAQTRSQVELGGPGGGTNPEELLAAAHANCFTSTISSLARSRGLQLDSVTTAATTRLAWGDGRDHHLASSALTVRIESPLPRGEIEELVRDAEAHCPVCNALRATMETSVRLI